MTEENFNLNAMQPCETQFIDKNCVSLHDTENCCVSNKNQSQHKINKKSCIILVLSRIYAQLFITIAVVAVLTEIAHGRIRLFTIHVYVYLYLLSGGIFIFIWGFANNIIQRSTRAKNDLEVLNNDPTQSWYFEFGLLVCGIAAFTCTCLKSAAALLSENCLNSAAVTLCILSGIFIVLQLHFFCSKNIRYMSSCFQNFSMMHLSATNAAVWLYIVLWESSTDWQDAHHSKHNSSLNWSQKDLNISVHSAESDAHSLNQSLYFPKHVVHFTSNCWWHIVPESELSPDILSIQLCLQNSSVGMLWKKISEYLYPFAVQYYLIVLFILYINQNSFVSKFKKMYISELPGEFKNVGHCFCLSKGFYLGCLYFLVSIVIIILYFIFNIKNFDIVVMSMLCIIYASAIFAVLVALCQIKPAIVKIEGPFNCYQEIGIYFVYAYAISNLLVGSFSGEKYKNLLLILVALLMVLHAISQYILIKSVSKSRQAVNFLILCNASLWLLESSVYCYQSQANMQLEIYGVAWSIMNRIIIPCLAFYRFNSLLLFSNLSKYLSAEYL